MLRHNSLPGIVTSQMKRFIVTWSELEGNNDTTMLAESVYCIRVLLFRGILKKEWNRAQTEL